MEKFLQVILGRPQKMTVDSGDGVLQCTGSKMDTVRCPHPIEDLRELMGNLSPGIEITDVPATREVVEDGRHVGKALQGRVQLLLFGCVFFVIEEVKKNLEKLRKGHGQQRLT